MRHFILFFFILCFISSKAQLSGSYTINPAGTNGGSNFISFNHAVDSLVSVGVSGAVTFQVSDGVYAEQFEIPAINGASSQNTIRFTGNQSDSTAVIVTHPSTSNNAVLNYVIKLNGADYITFEYFHLDRSGTEKYGTVLTFENQCDHNSFLHNQLSGSYIGGFGGVSALIYSNLYNDNFNTFSYNHFRRATSIALYYGSSAKEEGTIFSNNSADSCKAGIYLKYQKGPQVLNNSFNLIASSNYHSGIEIRNCNEGPVIAGNTIYFKSLGDAIGVVDSDCDPNQPGLIYNNSIQAVGSSYTDGIYFYSSDNYQLYYNSVDASGSSSSLYSSTPLSLTYNSKGIDLRNNIFNRNNKGVAMRADTGSIVSSFCNSFFNDGDVLIYQGQDFTLEDWKTTIGVDSGSLNSDPLFSGFPLIPRDILLDGKAKYTNSITTDLLGNNRQTGQSDIGAIEFTPASLDIRLLDRENSDYNACHGLTPLDLFIRNNGTSITGNIFIRYNSNFSGWVDTTVQISLVAGQDTLYHLKDIPAVNGTNYLQIEAYALGLGADADSSDNYQYYTFKSLMSGNYQISGSNPDYPNLQSCFDAMQSRGICGPVVLNIADGDYLQSSRLKSISGASSTNTITIQSASQDSSKVRLYYPSSNVGGTNHVLWIEGADYVRLKHITLERTGTNSYACLLRISDNAMNPEISHCVFRGNYRGSSSSSLIASFSQDDNNDSVKIYNNAFKAAPYGVYLYSQIESQGTRIFNNEFDSIRDYGIRLFKHPGVEILNNKMTAIPTTSSPTGVFLDSCSDFTIAYNQMDFTLGKSSLYFLRCFAGSSQNRVFNNIINTGAGNNYAGIYSYQSNAIAFYYNTIRINTYNGLKNNACVETEFGNGPSHIFRNNIFLNEAEGKVFINSDNSIQTSNHNVLFTNGAVFADVASGSVDFDGWKSSGLDVNSHNRNAMLTSTWVPQNAYINNSASPISGVMDDFFGTMRGNNPDPGAIEFEIDSFVSIGDVILASKCEDEKGTLAIVLNNLGTTKQQGIQIEIDASGTNNGSFSLLLNDTIYPMTAKTVYLQDTLNSIGLDSLVVRVIAKGTLMGGANDTFYRTFRIYPLPQISTTLDSGCVGVPLNFNSTITIPSPDSLQGVTWFFGDGSKDQNTDAVHTYLMEGLYAIRLIAVSGFGCSNEKIEMLLVHALPDASFSSNVTERTIQPVVNNPRIPGATYTWDFGDGNQDTGYSVQHSYVVDGTYSVKLTVGSAPCTADHSESVLIENLAIAKKSEFQFEIYPNPNKGDFILELAEPASQSTFIEIYDISGKCIQRFEIETGRQQIQLNNALSPGSYLVWVETQNLHAVKKLIVH